MSESGGSVECAHPEDAGHWDPKVEAMRCACCGQLRPARWVKLTAKQVADLVFMGHIGVQEGQARLSQSGQANE